MPTARTVLTPIDLTADSASVITTVAAVATMTVPDPGGFRALIQVTNGSDAAVNVTVRASGNGVNAAGNAQPAAEPWNTVYTQSTVGDLVVSVAAGDTVVIPVVTTDRFTQPDGSLSIDFASITDMTVVVLREPYNAAGIANP